MKAELTMFWLSHTFNPFYKINSKLNEYIFSKWRKTQNPKAKVCACSQDTWLPFLEDEKNIWSSNKKVHSSKTSHRKSTIKTSVYHHLQARRMCVVLYITLNNCKRDSKIISSCLPCVCANGYHLLRSLHAKSVAGCGVHSSPHWPKHVWAS